MEHCLRRPLACTFAAALAALAGCASTSTVDTHTTALTYSSGRGLVPPAPRPAIASAPIAPVQAQAADTDAPLAIVYFDFDRDEVKPSYHDALARHARVLRAQAHRRAVIEGHTDSAGSAEYNLALGHRRAEAVRRALLSLGAREEQLEAVSFGETSPATEGEDAQSRALNRRAEIRPAAAP